MKKLFAIVMGVLFLSAGNCLAETENVNTDIYYRPSLMDKIEDSTLDFAESVGDATTDAARKTGTFIKDKSKTAASATGNAVKKGAKKTGQAMKKGAKKAGCATKKGAKKTGQAVKKGAKKATNWSATKVRNGAEKVIIKTEEVNETPVQTTPAIEE